MKELTPGVQSIIDRWYNNVQHDIVHYWEQDDTWFVVIRHYSSTEDVVKLDFVRIFPSFRMEGEYHISIDKTVNV